MANNVTFKYDRASKILHAEDDFDIKTTQDVDTFFAKYAEEIKSIGEKFYLVAHIDRLIVHPEVAEYYGEAARRATSEMLLGLARWGRDSDARMSLRTTAMKAKMSYEIYSTREEALRAIEKMRAAQAEKQK